MRCVIQSNISVLVNYVLNKFRYYNHFKASNVDESLNTSQVSHRQTFPNVIPCVFYPIFMRVCIGVMGGAAWGSAYQCALYTATVCGEERDVMGAGVRIKHEW